MAYREHRTYHSEFRVSSSLINEQFIYLAHWHMEVELVYVIEGSLKMGINRNIYTAEQGDVAICGSGDIHFYSGGVPNTRAILIVFEPKLIGASRGWSSRTSFPNPIIKAEQLKSEQNAIQHAFQHIYRENRDQQNGWEMLIASDINKICGLLIRSAASGFVQDRDHDLNLRGNEMMQDVIRYIEKKYNEDLTLEDTSKTFNFSPTYFSRVFNKAVGMNFRTYINHIRVMQAEQLILNTDHSLTSIAMECGFGSIRSFNRIFKFIKGIAPSSLRAEGRN